MIALSGKPLAELINTAVERMRNGVRMEVACRAVLAEDGIENAPPALVDKLIAAVSDDLTGDTDFQDWKDWHITMLEFENERLFVKWGRAVDMAAQSATTTSGMILKLALNGCLSGPREFP